MAKEYSFYLGKSLEKLLKKMKKIFQEKSYSHKKSTRFSTSHIKNSTRNN